MMRSMFSGVSGLRTHQTRMDVIGNNIANVNTVGFKSGRVTFQEVFSQTLRGAGTPDSSTGRAGTNPMQVGLGVGISAIDTLMSRGSSQRTDNPTDMMIDGDGFFIIKGSKDSGFTFTRAGNFGIDEQGNLNLNGNSVCGWEYDYTNKKFDTDKQVAPLNIFSTRDSSGNITKDKRNLAASATSEIEISGNLNVSSSSAQKQTVPVIIYDSLGREYKVNVVFTRDATDASKWTVSADKIKVPQYKADGTPDLDPSGNQIYKEITPTLAGNIDFDSTGKPPSDPALTEFTLTLGAADIVPAADITAKVKLGGLTAYAGDTTAKPADVNGYPPGQLVNFSVGTDGIISGVYSNGQQQVLGMVGVAVFSNPAGLLKVGENMFIQSTNSGKYTNGVMLGTAGSGKLSPGTLEMSNVDLSKEFTDMIVTQRGFQANSRIITASDEMLQELVNLKR